MTSESFSVEGIRHSDVDRLESDMTIPIKPKSIAADISELTIYARVKTLQFFADIKHSFHADCNICRSVLPLSLSGHQIGVARFMLESVLLQAHRQRWICITGVAEQRSFRSQEVQFITREENGLTGNLILQTQSLQGYIAMGFWYSQRESRLRARINHGEPDTSHSSQHVW